MVSAICEKHIVCPPVNITENGTIIPPVTSLAMSGKAIPDSLEHCDGFFVILSVSEEDLKQRADPAMREVIHLMETGETPTPAVK